MPEKTRVGVVGVGHLGNHHARILSQIQEAELVGVNDIDAEKCRRVAQEYGTKSFDNLDQLLEQTDALSLVVPTTAHHPLAKRILESGKDLLIEKPITETVEQAEELVNLARKKGAIFQVGHIERFNPALQAIEKRPVDPKFIESHRMAQFNPRGTDVAVILDLMIHDIDLILSLVKSRISNIEAVGVPVIAESQDICNARISFENGCVANVTASRISARSLRKMRLFEKDSYVSLDFLSKSVEIYRLVEASQIPSDENAKKTVVGSIPVEKVGKSVIYERPKTDDQDMLTSEIESFLQAVRTRTSPKVTGEDGKRALEVALKIREKAEKHRKRSAGL
ncbi:MAG: Gfo/Idh/MocA family oxidoreductase [Candidatus Zixiibacteriota bacterium]|nr:MAG: Gfo/Idh/MocA family oxidoreductase [candidate division Zixibacteria bacterium]